MRKARRFRGVVLAALLLASQGSAWLHAAAVAHATCLEHGESIHTGALAANDADASPDTDAQRLRADTAAASAHEHCASGALLRWRDVALTAPVTTTLVQTCTTSLTRDSSRDLVLATAVYLVAPKTSPPRTGV